MPDVSYQSMRDAYGNFSIPKLDAMYGQAVNTAGPLAELARRGVLFHASMDVAGVAPGTSIGTTAAFALYNPSSSIDMVVQFAALSYVSGTLGIGVIDWVAHIAGAVTGTAITPENALTNGPAAQGKAFKTATVITGGRVFRPFANLPPMLATSVLTPWLFRDDVGGSITIPPGSSVSLQATAGAGTSPVVRYHACWAEVPVTRQ